MLGRVAVVVSVCFVLMVVGYYYSGVRGPLPTQTLGTPSPLPLTSSPALATPTPTPTLEPFEVPVEEALPNFDQAAVQTVDEWRLTEERVDFVHVARLRHVSPYPLPIMLRPLEDDANRKRFCAVLAEPRIPNRWSPYPWQQLKWPVCAGPEFPSRVQPCDDAEFVASVTDGWVNDGGLQPEVPGVIFQHLGNGSYRLFRTQAWEKRFHRPKPDSGTTRVKHFTMLATTLGRPFPVAHGHFPQESLPPALYLLEHIPPNCKLLVVWTSFTAKFWQLLIDRKVVEKSRLEIWDPKLFYRADTLYFVSSSPGCATDANWLPSEHRIQVMRRAFFDNPPASIAQCPSCNYILVLSREDASSRKLVNHKELISALEQRFPGTPIKQFVGRDWNSDLAGELLLWQKAALVIAPHGAGLFHLEFCTPGASVIEIGYTDGSAMIFPSAFYALAIAAQLRYHLVLAQGGLYSNLQVKVDEVVQLAAAALRT